ncbi:hypothetical protein SAMN06264855_1076 [Halorubrum vacuolatum]|uniref:Ig-like domain-containing protein n=1 Tax=Halorubrum vacuolatum TaxID=63740 RepID=A0A238WCQ6_HALVU|nr:hypothetical protein SAMN06264855_1076 [Halorubrum vacuolatum]
MYSGIVTDDETTVFEQSFTPESDQRHEFGDELPPGEYGVIVKLPDRSESRSYWNTALCNAHRVQTDIAADGHISHQVTCHSGNRNSH